MSISINGSHTPVFSVIACPLVCGHPSEARCHLLLQAILPQQGLLESADRWQGVLRYFGDDEIAHRLHSRWTGQSTRDVDGMTNVQRWEELEAEVAKVSRCAAVSTAGTPIIPNSTVPELF